MMVRDDQVLSDQEAGGNTVESIAACVEVHDAPDRNSGEPGSLVGRRVVQVQRGADAPFGEKRFADARASQGQFLGRFALMKLPDALRCVSEFGSTEFKQAN